LSGHQHRAQSRGANPPASDHRLDQFAASVAEARATNPAVAGLATQEDQFIDAAMDIGAHLDRQTVGAAWLILGQLMGTHLANVPPEHQASAVMTLLNIAKLAGERLYTGNGLPITVACPYAYGNGSQCSTTRTAPNRERLDVLLRAHVMQNHPGKEWPPPAEAGPQDEDAQLEGSTGECPNCGTQVHLDGGLIGFHPLQYVDGIPTVHTCRGAGKPPVSGGDAEQAPDAGEILIAGDGGPGVLSDGTGRVWPAGTPRPKHAPHELCDCRPGETYHCAAGQEDA
jgi:hypothetical protein